MSSSLLREKKLLEYKSKYNVKKTFLSKMFNLYLYSNKFKFNMWNLIILIFKFTLFNMYMQFVVVCGDLINTNN